MAGLFLVGCTQPASRVTPSATLAPTPTPACHQAGTTRDDHVFFPDTGENHSILVYLPPCYAEYTGAHFPVLYWTTYYGQSLFDTADRLAGEGFVPAFIIVVLDISPVKGYGADAQIINDVVPYIDAHYRTQADPRSRSITGISHGAAIAVRAAFQPPHLLAAWLS